ncbi:MAG: histidine phosphatase family protein [Bdellovibrionaceae bacterium]|nr:histidine phosphatase family protein [Pseudobdellovibrionaceae bacterium]
MNFILFRHAEKKSELVADSSLSQQGFNQARNLVQLVQNKKLPPPTHLFCSPRKRTKETLSFLAEHAHIKITTSPLLDLRTSPESAKDFRLRIQEFMVGFQLDIPDSPNKPPTIYVCTHQDWAEEFLTIIESSTDLSQPKYSSWPSGQYMYFAKSDLWHLVDFNRL